MISKKKREQAKARKSKSKAHWAKLLAQVGYTRMVERGLRSSRPDFPTLSICPTLPTSDAVGNGFARKPLPADARQFPVGVSHKQGPMLITASDRLEDMGGRKT